MARITPQQAITRLQQGKKKSKGVKVLDEYEAIGVAEDDIYILGNADGGILAPADDTLPPILGIWEEGGATMPPSMRDWLAEYALEVEWWQRIGEEISQDTPTNAQAKVKASPRHSVPVLLETKWSQLSPYNGKCIFDGKQCVTGCNATASAQIVYHWGKKGYHRGCTATPSYDTETNGYHVDALPPLAQYDYLNLVESPKTDKQKEAVQTLMMYLGRAFKSDYKPNGTGASPKVVASCLRDKVRMGKTISYIHATKLGESGFEAKVYNEMVNNRPTIIGGWTAKGGGHTFVADGYDAEQDLYHINWGWGGSYNGWFKMSALNPKASVAYNSTKVAIIGIQPDCIYGDVNGNGEVDIADAMQIVQAIQNGNNDSKYDINYDGKVTITDAQIIINKVLGL